MNFLSKHEKRADSGNRVLRSLESKQGAVRAGSKRAVSRRAVFSSRRPTSKHVAALSPFDETVPARDDEKEDDGEVEDEKVFDDEDLAPIFADTSTDALKEHKARKRIPYIPYHSHDFWTFEYRNCFRSEENESNEPPNFHDFFIDFDEMLPFIEDFLSKQPCKVLHLGCGSSKLSHELIKRMPHVNLVNTDYSKVVTEKLARRFSFHSSTKNRKVMEGIEYRCVDCRQLQLAFPQHSFDVVIEKALLDTLFCDSVSSVRQMLEEVYHVLSPKGVFIIFSSASPDLRRQYFKYPNGYLYKWKIGFVAGRLTNCYILRKVEQKGKKLDQRMMRERLEVIRRLRKGIKENFTKISLDVFFEGVHDLREFDDETILSFLEQFKPGYAPPNIKKQVVHKTTRSNDNGEDSSSESDGSSDDDEERLALDRELRIARKNFFSIKKKVENRLKNFSRTKEREKEKVGNALVAEQYAKQFSKKMEKQAIESFKHEHEETEEEKMKRLAKSRAAMPACDPIDPMIAWKIDDEEDYRVEEQAKRVGESEVLDSFWEERLVRQIQRYTSFLCSCREKEKETKILFARDVKLRNEVLGAKNGIVNE
eukprot:g803.t1